MKTGLDHHYLLSYISESNFKSSKGFEDEKMCGTLNNINIIATL